MKIYLGIAIGIIISSAVYAAFIFTQKNKEIIELDSGYLWINGGHVAYFKEPAGPRTRPKAQLIVGSGIERFILSDERNDSGGGIHIWYEDGDIKVFSFEGETEDSNYVLSDTNGDGQFDLRMVQNKDTRRGITQSIKYTYIPKEPGLTDHMPPDESKTATWQNQSR